MTKTKQLNAQTAIIKTAAIEIKALTISGRQVTFGVFRQLPVRELIDYSTLKMNGIPWGHVNYHPDKCVDHTEHVHVIWQDGQTLYRTNIYATQYWPNPHCENIKKAMALYAQSVVRFNFHGEYEKLGAMRSLISDLEQRGLCFPQGTYKKLYSRNPWRPATEEEVASVAHITQNIDIDFLDSFSTSYLSDLFNDRGGHIYQKYTKEFGDLFYNIKSNTILEVLTRSGHRVSTGINIQSFPEWLTKTLKDGAMQEDQHEKYVQGARDALNQYEDWTVKAKALYQPLCNLDQLYIAT